MTKDIAIALSGGGARGFAHIPVCAAFDECGVRPSRIAGTSMGAVIGALYASGMSAKDIGEQCAAMFASRTDVMARLVRSRRGGNSLFSFSFTKTGTLDPRTLLEAFLPQDLPARIEDLDIPFAAVATDFITGNEVVFDSGPLIEALAASIAFPPVMRPVLARDQVLIDGGVVNPVPHDIAGRDGAAVVVSDVILLHELETGSIPTPVAALVGSAQIMMRAIAREKYDRLPPALIVRPDVQNLMMFEFFKVDAIIAAGARAHDEVRGWLLANGAGTTAEHGDV